MLLQLKSQRKRQIRMSGGHQQNHAGITEVAIFLLADHTKLRKVCSFASLLAISLMVTSLNITIQVKDLVICIHATAQPMDNL